MYSLGMASEYESRTGPLYKVSRKILALPFLPPDAIRPSFDALAAAAHDPQLLQLIDYVRRCWIDNDMWPPEAWLCYRQSIRTNNDAESWHARLNRRTGSGNLGIYQLEERLFAEGKLVGLSMKIMSEERVLMFQRASTLRINSRLGKYYDEYEAGTRSANKLLRACARVYGYAVGHRWD